MRKLHVDGAIVVEGKYDKIHLSNIVDCPIIVTNGFRVFKDEETKALIRFYADRGGVVILTDSDSAGFKIRSHIKSFISAEKIRNVYVPDILGKEKRKTAPSKEGKLGVEGVDINIIVAAFEKAGVLTSEKKKEGRDITRLDLFEDGLMGGKDSSDKRKSLIQKLDLPERLSTSALLEILNHLVSYDEYKNIVEASQE